MILTLNVGSSSLKYALYDENLKSLEAGEVDSIDTLLQKMEKPYVVGHRIVHGGSEFIKPTRITDTVLKKLEMLIPFSPLHLPRELEIVKKVQELELPQVACFDTSFHRAMPTMHQHFPLPAFLWKEGVKRYGFHGLSYEYILHHLGEKAEEKKIIVAHLGSGCSMTSIDNKKPIDTTMGFTPAGGIMMATRSGDLDPGVLSYLMREKGYGPTQIDALVNEQSGLLGVSEKTGDMKELLKDAKSDRSSALSIHLFCYLARKSIGSLTASLGGLDHLIFTGGIGEKSKEIREEICKGLDYLDIKNKVEVIPTNENWMIALHTKNLLGL